VLAGIAQLGDDLTFRVDLDGKLAAGHYTMFVLIVVNGNSASADIRRIPVIIQSSP
jgi:hypothetical protein